MRLSVIVPVHDGASLLPHCLQALARSSRLADEIIVLDDGSTDASAAVAAAHGARVFETLGGPLGPACARNRGAEAAVGEILLFIDADVEVHVDTLARVESMFVDDSKMQALFGSYDDRPAAPGVASRFKNLLHHYVHQHGQRDARTFWAGCGAIRRSTFLRAGGFSEHFRQPSIEDIELGLRLHRASVPIRLCPEIQVTHLKRWSLSELWHTDVFQRAVPWSRIILREGALRSDLNLTWRNRVCAAVVWMGLLSFFVALGMLFDGRFEPAHGCALAASSFLLLGSVLNAQLYLFFFRHGGIGFALAAWTLHLVYLLYSSAVFSVLLLSQIWQVGPIRRHASK